MTTLAQRRRTYNRLHIICEVYGQPGWLAALERAGRKTIETNSRRFVSARKGERKDSPVEPVVSSLGKRETQAVVVRQPGRENRQTSDAPRWAENRRMSQ